MKWPIFIIFFFHIKGYAQSQENEYKKMIDSAISIKSIDFFKSYKRLPVSSNPGKESLYLIDENDLPYKYAGVETGLSLKAINIFDTKNKKYLEKGIHAWKIIPVLKGSTLKISIVDFFITYRNADYKYVNGGGAEIIFEYLCNENKWVLVKSKNQGL